MARTSKKTLLSAVLHAVAYHAKKHVVRDDLPPGFAADMEIEIVGKVGRQSITEKLIGRLTVGHDSEASSSAKADETHVVAWLLEHFDEKQQDNLYRALIAHKRQQGSLPPVAEATARRAKQLLTALRDQTTVTRRGTVRFAPSTE